jgi:hypothetical protein
MKYVAQLFLAALAFPALAAWTPPPSPDPQKILREARGDREAGRFADALAKLVWFHQHAMEYNESLSGIRRTSALADWRLLAYRYGPAREKLVAIRDASARDVMHGAKTARASFIDVAAINETLDEEERTRALFMNLDRTNPVLAKDVYTRAQPILVRSGDYALCGKYIDPAVSLEHLTTAYRTGARYARRAMGGDVDLAQLQFTSEAALVTALLARNARMNEARKFADDALKVVDIPRFHTELQAALAGELPDLGPSESMRTLTRALERAGAYLGF